MIECRAVGVNTRLHSEAQSGQLHAKAIGDGHSAAFSSPTRVMTRSEKRPCGRSTTESMAPEQSLQMALCKRGTGPTVTFPSYIVGIHTATQFTRLPGTQWPESSSPPRAVVGRSRNPLPHEQCRLSE